MIRTTTASPRRRIVAAARPRLGLLLILALLCAGAASAPKAAASSNSNAAATKTVDLRLPADYVTHGEDEYACTTVELPRAPHKVVAVEPLAEQGTVHHILLFGCAVPHVLPTEDSPRPVWPCRHVRACAGGSENIFYGWGKNAPALRLPEGVGYSVGASPGAGGIRYVVAQVHYLQPKPRGDVSGVRLHLSSQARPYAGGMLSYASLFRIPPGQKAFSVPNACCYRGFQPLHPFAVRVHTHALGRGVALVRHPPLQPGGGGEAARRAGRAAPELVAHGDPQQPQGFFPLPASSSSSSSSSSPSNLPKVLVPGDPLTATCEFDSTTSKHFVNAGATHGDEMCNLYLMLFSPLPHLEMCADGAALVDDRSPGNLPPARSGARFLADPYPRWKPPALPSANPAGNEGGDNGQLGDVASVAVGPDGTLWALHRGARRWGGSSFDPSTNVALDSSPIAEHVVVAMDPDTGAVRKRWGGGIFVMPHMITVDLRSGDLWIADVGRHQVMRFSPEGKLLQELGEKGVPGSDDTHFCKPAQARPLRDGGVVVADGYCNSRAVRFDAAGKFLQQYAISGGGGGGGGGAEDGGGGFLGVGSRRRAGYEDPPAVKPAAGDGYTVFAGEGESVGAELAEARRAANYRAARRGTSRSQGGGVSGAAASSSLSVPPMLVVHSLLADECEGVLRLADREGRRVVAFDLETGALLGVTRTKWPVWALVAGPYGRSLALLFDAASGLDAELADADRPTSAVWPLSGTAGKWPHDAALGAAPLALTGAGERLFALWTAPLCPDAPCGPVLKHVLFPRGFGGPSGGIGDALAAEGAADGLGGGGDAMADDDGGESALLSSYGSLQRPKEVAAHYVPSVSGGGEGAEDAGAAPGSGGDGAGDPDATPEEGAALREGLRVVAAELDSAALAGPGAGEDFRVVRGGGGGSAAGAGGSAGRLALVAAALAAAAAVAVSQACGGGGAFGGSRAGRGGAASAAAAGDGFTTARYPPHRPVRTDDPDAAPLFGGGAGGGKGNGGNSSSGGNGGGGAF